MIRLHPIAVQRVCIAAIFVVAAALAGAGCGDADAPRGTHDGPAPAVDATGADVPEINWPGDADPAVVQAVNDAADALRGQRDAAAAWGEMGMVLLAHEIDAEAVVCFTQASRLAPDEARWPYLAGHALADTDPHEASLRFAAAVERGGEHAVLSRLRLAELMLILGRDDDAARHFQSVLNAEPNHARALLGLGRIAVEKQEWSKAKDFLSRAAADARAAKQAHLLLARAALAMGDPDAAKHHQQQADQLGQPAWPDPIVAQAEAHRAGLKAILVRADVLFGQGQLHESIAVLRDATVEYPRSIWAWVLLGRALIRADELAAAEEALRRALQIDPEAIEALFRLGVVHMKRKEYGDGAGMFEKATALKPDFAMAHYNLAYCRWQGGDLRAAIAAYEAAGRYQPNHFDTHAALGQVLALDGQYQKALEVFGRALELKPGDTWVTQRIAAVRRAMEEKQR